MRRPARASSARYSRSASSAAESTAAIDADAAEAVRAVGGRDVSSASGSRAEAPHADRTSIPASASRVRVADSRMRGSADAAGTGRLIGSISSVRGDDGAASCDACGSCNLMCGSAPALRRGCAGTERETAPAAQGCRGRRRDRQLGTVPNRRSRTESGGGQATVCPVRAGDGTVTRQWITSLFAVAHRAWTSRPSGRPGRSGDAQRASLER
jgi:hypothetical protein